LAEPAREEARSSDLVTAAGVLTVISGVLVLLPAVATVWVSPLLKLPSFRILDFIGTLLIGGIAIAGGAATLTKKNLMLGVIGATIPLGTSFYNTLVSAYLILNLPQGTVELSNALPDNVSYIVWPPILVLSILSLIFLAKHAHV
jgi:hypothetical protein